MCAVEVSGLCRAAGALSVMQITRRIKRASNPLWVHRVVSTVVQVTSDPRSTDMVRPPPHVSKVPILLQKYFWGDEPKFSETLMRLAPRDVRDHIVSRQNDHGPSYRRHGASQRQRCLGIDFREIFGVVGFSTFATKSAKRRYLGMPAMAGDVGSEVADPDYSGRPEARIASIRGVASTGTQPMAEH